MYFDIEPYLGEIMMISWNFPPKGWAFCNGQFLPINQNQALFSLLGTTYGGNGQTTFALPDFRGRVPVGVGPSFVQGQKGGEESHTLTMNELAQHGHAVTKGVINAKAGTTASQKTPENAYFAANAAEPKRFTNKPDSGMANIAPVSSGNVGGSQAHNNMAPSATINFVIALQGVFPPRN